MDLIEFPCNILKTIPLCEQCNKAKEWCNQGAEICLPLEMLIQLCSEPSTMKKLEMIDNVRTYLED
jgi:hypothetical protein